MGSSYQLKFSTSETKRLNKKKNNGDGRSFKQTTKQNLSIFLHIVFTLYYYYYSREDLPSEFRVHALDLFWAFAFIRCNFALVLCYFLSLSASSASDSYMLYYASAHICQVVPDVLLGATDSPKTSQGQA